MLIHPVTRCTNPTSSSGTSIRTANTSGQRAAARESSRRANRASHHRTRQPSPNILLEAQAAAPNLSVTPDGAAEGMDLGYGRRLSRFYIASKSTCGLHRGELGVRTSGNARNGDFGTSDCCLRLTYGISKMDVMTLYLLSFLCGFGVGG